MKNTSLPNFDLPSHISPRPNLRPIPDLRALFNHRIRPAPNLPPELCQRRDQRSGMNPPQWWRCGWRKKCRNLAKGSRWIGYPNLIFSQIFGSLQPNHQSPRFRRPCRGLIPWMGKKGNFLAPCPLQIGYQCIDA
ncbi:MAG: hypothetical protein RLZZ374_1043 [Cyanobacteriota bacterium]